MRNYSILFHEDDLPDEPRTGQDEDDGTVDPE
jgi:hypothetical protein